MLSFRAILSREGLTLADVACRHEVGDGIPEQYTGAHSLVFVRRGLFIRHVEGREVVLDPSVAYCLEPGGEYRYDHPQGHGDDCTMLGIDERLFGQLPGGGHRLPSGALPTAPEIDLEHRMLIAAARRGGDEHEVVERALTLIAITIGGLQSEPRRAPRSDRTRERQTLVARAREALAVNPDRSLSDLAQALAVSPYHLSRAFRSVTGHTLARHRMRLRVRQALERLAGGEHDLARLAADLGFSDQSYMCRVIRAETASTPGALRYALT